MNKKTIINQKTIIVPLILIAIFSFITTIATRSIKNSILASAQISTNTQSELFFSSNYIPTATPSQENSSETPSKTVSEEYYITIHNDKIGVFRNYETEPFIVANVPVYLLPKGDIQILQKGLHANSMTQVKSILEDYES